MTFILDVIDPPGCDAAGVPLDWGRCRCQNEIPGGMGSLADALYQRDEACPDCHGHGSLKAAALAMLEPRLRSDHINREHSRLVPPFKPEELPADKCASLDQIETHAMNANRVAEEAGASFVVRCEGCGHPMSAGVWEPERQPSALDGSLTYVEEHALLRLRSGGYEESEIGAYGPVHWSSCDGGCRHDGPRRADAGLVAVEWVYREVDGSDIRFVAGPEIQASWRAVDVRPLGHAHDLRPHKLKVLCLRCWTSDSVATT